MLVLSEIMLLISTVLTILELVNTLPDKTCDRIKVGQNWYERTVLWTNIGRPYNLNVHKASNILFFSYTTPETYSDVDFQLAYYNIDNKDCQSIVGIRGGCSVAIDQANDEIYLGGSEGIYKYNMVTKLADFYKESGVNVWSLFYKRNLFYIRYPDQKLHIEIDGKFVVVKEFANTEIDYFHVNNDNVIYFANKTGLYKYNKTMYGIEVVNELISVRQITEDNNGNMYVCSNLGLFLDVKAEGLKRILDMRSILSVAFDRNNNFIISDEKAIIKLEISRHGCLDNDVHW